MVPMTSSSLHHDDIRNDIIKPCKVISSEVTSGDVNDAGMMTSLLNYLLLLVHLCLLHYTYYFNGLNYSI